MKKNIIVSDKKLNLSDSDISKIKKLFDDTIREYLEGADWIERNNYYVIDAINDALDEAEKKLKDF